MDLITGTTCADFSCAPVKESTNPKVVVSPSAVASSGRYKSNNSSLFRTCQ